MTHQKIQNLGHLFAQVAMAGAIGAGVSSAVAQSGPPPQYYHQSVSISPTDVQAGQPARVTLTVTEVSGNQASNGTSASGSLLLPAPMVLASVPTAGTCQNVQSSNAVGGKELNFSVDPTAANGSCTVVADIEWPTWAAALCGPGAKVSAINPAVPEDVNLNIPRKPADVIPLTCSTQASWLVGPPGPPGPPGDCCSASKQAQQP